MFQVGRLLTAGNYVRARVFSRHREAVKIIERAGNVVGKARVRNSAGSRLPLTQQEVSRAHHFLPVHGI